MGAHARAWGRTLGSTPALPDTTWQGAGGVLGAVIEHPYETLNTCGLLFALGLTYAVFRRIGAGWGLFVLASIVPPLAAGGVLSMGRLTSTLFPVFLALASLLSPRAALACAGAFGVLQGLAAVVLHRASTLLTRALPRLPTLPRLPKFNCQEFGLPRLRER